MLHDIYVVNEKNEASFLRKKTKKFDFDSMNKQELNALITRMKEVMHKAQGIGLSANQIGLPFKAFIAEVPTKDGAKFYALFNPTIEKKSKDTVEDEEGCLSVPGVFGGVSRPEKITVAAFDKNGKPMKIKAWGLLARVFQHEMDHLEGTLFIDKSKNLHHADSTY